jgi:hypothetical protein
MSVQLGQNSGIAQFTPELQQKLFERGVNGIDITNGIPRRQPSPEYLERMQTLENVYDMVQKGELVPKSTIPVRETPNQQTYIQQQPVVQNAPVNVQNETNVQSNENAQQDDIMKMLFPEQSNPVPPVNPVVNQVPAVSDGTTQNATPKINWEEIVYEQQNMLVNTAAKQGVRGESVLEWMGQLKPEDYVEMYKAYQSYRPEQQQMPVTNTIQNQNQSLINWSQNQQVQQYAPSIADLPGANITTVRRDDTRPAHPFGLR